MTGGRLAAALEAFAESETPDTRRQVLEALANADLIFPTAERGPGEQSVRLAFNALASLPGFNTRPTKGPARTARRSTNRSVGSLRVPPWHKAHPRAATRSDATRR